MVSRNDPEKLNCHRSTIHFMQTPNLNNALDFSGKVSLITGGSRGIGAGIARRFAEAGGSVVVSYVKGEQAAQEVVAQIRAANGLAQAIQADVTLAHDVDRMISHVVEQYGRLDVLVNNAGTYPVSTLLEVSDAEWEQVLAANLTGTHFCTQRAARAMVALSEQAESNHGSGAIVNISSIEATSTASCPQPLFRSQSWSGAVYAQRSLGTGRAWDPSKCGSTRSNRSARAGTRMAGGSAELAGARSAGASWNSGRHCRRLHLPGLSSGSLDYRRNTHC